MSTPIQSLHLQASMLVFRYMPAQRTLRRVWRRLCLPFTLIKLLYIHRMTGPPPPLKIRTRSHSISRSTEEKAVKERVIQVKSELLTKLPFEIRQIIWKECLGGKKLHLKLHHRRIISQCCTEHNLPDPCWEFFGLQKKDRKEKRPKLQLLSLLMTCHQVYSEAKEYLYTENVFDSLFSESILYLPRVIPQQRLNSIRSLYFLWYLEEPPLSRRDSYNHLHHRHDKDVWQTMWKNLAMMTGLTDLGIQLYIDPVWHMWWTSEELKLLQMVKSISAPKKFDLYVPFATIAKKSELRQFPCTIHRTVEGRTYID